MTFQLRMFEERLDTGTGILPQCAQPVIRNLRCRYMDNLNHFSPHFAQGMSVQVAHSPG